MKKHLFVVFLFFITTISAQTELDLPSTEFSYLKGEAASTEQEYLSALNYYFEALQNTFDVDNQFHIINQINLIFEEIQANKEQLKNESADIPDDTYFVYDAFDLALTRNEDWQFGFKNRAGELVIPCKYDEILPFGRLGYTKAKRDNVDYYIDTKGNAFEFVTSIEEITADTKGLDLSNQNLETFPTEILNYPQLEVLILDKAKLSIPEEIRQLKNLKILSVASCNLEQLEVLNLSGNYFRIFPAQIAKLKNLKRLLMIRCTLNRVSLEIGNMSSLEMVDLSF